jgi:hypothetical protein
VAIAVLLLQLEQGTASLRWRDASSLTQRRITGGFAGEAG